MLRLHSRVDGDPSSRYNLQCFRQPIYMQLSLMGTWPCPLAPTEKLAYEESMGFRAKPTRGPSFASYLNTANVVRRNGRPNKAALRGIPGTVPLTIKFETQSEGSFSNVHPY